MADRRGKLRMLMPDIYTLFDRLEDFGRRHLWLTALWTSLLALIAVFVVLSQREFTGILYEGF
jgi:hypothetical protein